MKRHWLIYGVIFALFYFIFICNLGLPPLLDVDETRYADMARFMWRSGEYTTLYLDNRIFWDKPPLFFWVLTFSYKLLGVSEFSVRIPSVITALSCIVALFIALKKVISERVALIAAVILATSVEFVIFSRVSILDMLFCANITLSLICGLMTYFVQEQNKKYLWWMFYVFSALGILTKGIPAVVIPFGTMFFVGLWKKNLTEFFKPKYFCIGCLLFMIIALPWHILMYKIHGIAFIREYIVKHHIQRFLGSEEIGRKHSVLYYIPTLIVGFLPWTMSFMCGITKLIRKKRHDFITMNLIGFVFSLIFFSLSSTKLITYILPLYPMSAAICAYLWYHPYYNKEIVLSVKVTNYAFILFGILVALSGLYLPADIYSAIKPLQIPVALAFILGGIWFKKREAFVAYVLLTAFLASFVLPKSLNIWYEFGQNELMEYANYAKANNLPLAAYNLWERFSLQYYYDGDIEYYLNGKAYGAKYVQTTKYEGNFKGKPVVLKNSKLKQLDIKYKFIQKGKKYSLIEECHE